MARPGYYEELQSSHPDLEVVRAAGAHVCCGVALERGVRPGKMRDAWVVGHSRRCAVRIKAREFYLSNHLYPPMLAAYMTGWPTCLYCGVDFYAEYLSGPLKVEYMRSVTPERRREIRVGLASIAAELRETAVGDEEPPGRAA